MLLAFARARRYNYRLSVSYKSCMLMLVHYYQTAAHALSANSSRGFLYMGLH
jgi:hypothetical protein